MGTNGPLIRIDYHRRLVIITQSHYTYSLKHQTKLKKQKTCVVKNARVYIFLNASHPKIAREKVISEQQGARLNKNIPTTTRNLAQTDT